MKFLKKITSGFNKMIDDCRKALKSIKEPDWYEVDYSDDKFWDDYLRAAETRKLQFIDKDTKYKFYYSEMDEEEQEWRR